MPKRKGKNHPMYTHGLTKHPLYSVWGSMKDRCLRPNDKKYEYYGERGIRICDEWENDFLSFYEWSMKSGYRKGLSIDRIDNDGNYEPSNCRWTTTAIQSRNRSDNRRIEINGQTKCLIEWIEELDIDRSTFYKRLEMGWDEEKSLTTPNMVRRRITIDGVCKNVAEWCRFYNMDYSTYKWRRKNGMGEVEALQKPLRKYARRDMEVQK